LNVVDCLRVRGFDVVYRIAFIFHLTLEKLRNLLKAKEINIVNEEFKTPLTVYNFKVVMQMTRTETLAEITDKYLNKLFKENIPKIMHLIVEDRFQILKTFLHTIDKVCKKAIDLQKERLKDEIAFVHISLIRSDAIFGNFNYRIDAFNEKWYGDKVECCTYWDANFMFRFFQDAIEKVYFHFKDYPRILHPYDLQTLKMMEIVKYHIFAVEVILAMIKQAIELESFKNMQKNDEFKIIAGEYMGAAKTIYPFSQEDEGVGALVFEPMFSSLNVEAEVLR